MRSTTLTCCIAALLLLTACHRAPRFEVSGAITGAEGELLYLEHTALSGTTVEDSCLLRSDGTFRLRGAAPDYPDFYRLRLRQKYALLIVDSIEHISLTTTLDSLQLTDAFIGSEQSVQVAALRRSLREQPIDEHRAYAQQMIMAHPASMVAYYAVFQSKQGEPVFSMNDPEQLKYYKVVATSMHVWMPDYVRTTNEMIMRQYIDESESAFLDIALPNAYGDTCRLSDHLGKVIILDFSSSQIDQANAYVLALRELDNKYNSRGLDIYSVSVDQSQLIWEDHVKNLPWTCVRTSTTAPLLTYNVGSVPTLFLIDRKGVVQGRYTDFDQLEAAIKKYL